MADKRRRAAGPLVVAAANPRYFTVESADPAEQRAVYLTGSHVWNNFHDGMGPGAACAERPEPYDYDAYLDFLEEHGHNFIRLWRWEHFRSQAAGGAFHLCMSPQPWPRTGPGTASDGKPRFDLSRFDQTYFDRLRERVVAAGRRGVYVAVMLFDGWALHLSPPPDNLEGHPFHAGNNLGQAAITSIRDYQVLPLDPRVQALQEAYVRKVVDTVQDLPNVLYEVANESTGDPTNPEVGDSTQWQYWVIDLLKRYELERGYDQHPVGMTMQFPVPDQRKVNEPLFNGPADWVSPGFDDQHFDPASGQGPPASTRWLTNPPPADGAKVVISDTDHYAPGRGDALWAWKSFLRGHHPILMDYGIIDLVHPLDPSLGVPSYESLEAARYAMGDTRRFAEDVDLIHMEPRGELSSTGYALANPGREYLVLDPGEGGGRFTVTLPVGGYAARWYSVTDRAAAAAPEVTADDSTAAAFSAPFGTPGSAILHLRRTAG